MVRKAGTPEDEAKVKELSAELKANPNGGSLAKPSIHTKLVAIMASVGSLEATGRNQHFRYDYFEAVEVAGHFRREFVKHGLSFMSDVVTSDVQPRGPKSLVTSLKVLFTITDTETGETVSGHGFGQGDDTGDKGANKAFAGALKYWLLKTFMVGGEDAEADEQTDRRATRSESRDVTVEDSDIKGIERGGRSSTATDVQVKRIRSLTNELGYNVPKLLDLIEDVLGVEVELSGDDPDDERMALKKWIDEMSADDAGKLIQYMEKMLEEE